MEKYTLEVAGLTRQLNICPLNEKVSIAAFIMFGDVELTVKASELLAAKAPAHDVIITAESKGIPLAYEMARQLHVPYVVARKSQKLYMSNPISVDVKSITTARIQTLFLDADDVKLIKEKRVLVVDDVISTGESVSAVETLIERCGGIVAGKMAVLAEGDAADRTDITYLSKLPLIFKD